MTPSQIETAARRRLNAVSSDFWSSTEIIEDCLYFACLDVATRARCIEATSTASSVASTASYSKPTNAIEIKQITYDSQKLELLPEREYFSLNLNGQTATVGRPQWYYLWGDNYILYPTPDQSSLSISIRSVNEPAAVTSGSTLEIPSQFHNRLVNGVCYYMLLKDVDDPRTPIFEARWIRDVQDCVDEWSRSKHADKMPRVRLEETLLTTDTGIV